MNREYDELLRALYSLEAAKGMDFKLERVQETLRQLGNPHLRYPVIHIAGTNGKGSVAAMMHAILSATGERVGLYTSPHLVHFTERIRVADGEIAEDTVVSLAKEVQAVASAHEIPLTFFELVTVMAFLHFARSAVSVAVVEVGLGGRLDATNVVEPAVSVITGIGMDHQEFLGDSLESIAYEKAGIIKPGRVVVVGRVNEVARGVISRVAAERGAPMLLAGRDFGWYTTPQGLGFRGPEGEIESLALGLAGKHQRDNAALAIMSALAPGSPIRPTEAAIRTGLESVRWPGRLDVVQPHPRVVLDGAHNPEAVAALVRDLPAVTGRGPVHLLLSVMRDKDWPAMIDLIKPVVSRVTVTRALPARAAPPEALAACFQPQLPVKIVEDPLLALEHALEGVGPSETLLVCGSLFLIGAVYPYFLKRTGRHSVFDPPGTLHP